MEVAKLADALCGKNNIQAYRLLPVKHGPGL
jgi:hypothetical protein